MNEDDRDFPTFESDDIQTIGQHKRMKKKIKVSNEARQIAHEILASPENADKSEVQLFAELLEVQVAVSKRWFAVGMLIGVALGVGLTFWVF